MKNTPNKGPSSLSQKLQGVSKQKAKIAAAVLITLGIGYGVTKCSQKESKQDFTIETPSDLQGRRFGDLYSSYLGNEGVPFKVGDSIYFNPDKIIDNLYDQKFRRKNTKGLKVAKEFYQENVAPIDFNEVEPITLDEYIESIQDEIDAVDDNFDRDSFNEDYLKGNPQRIHLFKELRKNIDAESLVAYSMAELFPDKSGELNKAFLSFLLQNAGEKFLYNLPAVNDDLASFGPYQFTYYALADFGNTKNGASNLNKYLPTDQQLPGSVIQLHGKNHHKAAYLFALYNIATKLISRNFTSINTKALDLLSQKSNKGDLAELIAIMHNKPAKGREFLNERYRLRNDDRYDKNKNNKVDMFEANPREKAVSGYGKKAYYNRKAL